MAKPFSKEWWTEPRAQAVAILLFSVVEGLFAVLRSVLAQLSLRLHAGISQSPRLGEEDQATFLRLQAGRSGLVAVLPLAIVSAVLATVIVLLAVRSLKTDVRPPVRLFLLQMLVGLAQVAASWAIDSDPLLPLVFTGVVLATPLIIRWDQRLRERSRATGRS